MGAGSFTEQVSRSRDDGRCDDRRSPPLKLSATAEGARRSAGPLPCGNAVHSRMTHSSYLRLALALSSLLLMLASARESSAQAASRRPPLSGADIAEIIALESLEDRRDFDPVALQRIAAAAHPELRRRTALALGRLYDFRGRAILATMRNDADTIVLATVVWATGQLIDTSAIGWINGLLQSPATRPGITTESAGAFGKIRTPETTAHLETFLLAARVGPDTRTAIGEALLSIGRARPAPAIAVAARWARSPDPELRWRATWSLGPVSDTSRTTLLLMLAKDPSGEVRHWAIRHLGWDPKDSLSPKPEQTRALLLDAMNDPDRRVRAEAIQSLGTHNDSVTRGRVLALLDNGDSWISAAVIEAITWNPDTSAVTVAALLRATHSSRPPALRAAAITALGGIAPHAAVDPAVEMAVDTSLTARRAVADLLSVLGSAGLPAATALMGDRDLRVRTSAVSALLTIADSTDSVEDRRKARHTAMGVGDIVSRTAATRTMRAWADTSDIPLLLDAYAVALRDSSPAAVHAAIGTLAAIGRADSNAWARFFARFPSSPSDVVYGIVGRAYGPKTVAHWGNARPARTSRTDADYERIVRTLVVPAYNGAHPPRLVWETSRGAFTTELNALDAPLATDYLMQLAARGAITGVRYERVIPNFVAQQGAVLIDQPLQRDEMGRGRLVRGNLSWGSMVAQQGRRGPGSSYDTGPAVYTFAHTPQPHNEGDFTALGRVVDGMQVIDRIERGDEVKAVRIVRR